MCTSTNLELVVTLNVNLLKRSRFRPSSGTPLYRPTNASSPILQASSLEFVFMNLSAHYLKYISFDALLTLCPFPTPNKRDAVSHPEIA